MPERGVRRGVCWLILLGLAAGAVPASSAADLTALPRDAWPTNGGNLHNQCYSPLDQINRDNVGGLKAAWRARLDGSGTEVRHSGEAQPIVHNGVVYVVTGDDDVFALEAATGERLWKYSAFLYPEISVARCGWTSRGVGLGDGKVFVGQLDGRLVALDQRSGEIAWAD